MIPTLTHTQRQLRRVYVLHWAWTTRILSQPPTKPSPGGGSGVITVGSTVKVSGAKYATGQTIPGWVKSTTHKVSEINGDRALLGRDGGICSWVYLKDLTLVSGGVAKPIEVGCQVTINKGAVYGGLTSARGNKVPAAQLAPKNIRSAKNPGE